MKRIFILSGSPRGKKSICNSAINKIVSGVKENTAEELQVCFYDMHNAEIQYCRGCTECFKNGKCTLDQQDSIEEIKKEMMQADLLILATPVYAANVSGYMKNFIDRLSYWLHIMPLIGKKAILINTSSGNGNQMVNSIMKVVSCGLGLSVIGILNIYINNANDLGQIDLEVNQRQINCAVKSIANWINTGDYVNLYSKELSALYSVMRNDICENQNEEHAEYKFWKSNKMFEYDSYSEYLNYREGGC